MFCEITDFELLPYTIPNLADPSDENANDGTFDAYCSQVEEEVLTELLGVSLYEQFVLGLAAPSPDVWWTRLAEGYAFQIDGKNYLWKGMKWLLRPYVWFMWMRDNAVKKTQSGAVIDVSENSESVSLAKELCMAYNDFATKTGYIACDLNRNTLYGFLKSDPDHYSDLNIEDSEIECINHYNL